MAKHFLQGSQVRPMLKHVAGEAMPKKMRVDGLIQAGALCVKLYAMPKGTPI